MIPPGSVLRHELGRRLELLLPKNELPLWTYVYGGKPKPFFHPLRTLSGHCLTLLEPHDHIWHRGLWFAIKFVNGKNFWEERQPFGVQRTGWLPNVEHGVNGAIYWESEINWLLPNVSVPLIREDRSITFRILNDEAYALDWDIRLRAETDLLLDRTPFTTWGGYGGLTLRGSRDWHETRLLFSDGSTSVRPTGNRAKWCDLSGVFDGEGDHRGGLAIFDHPGNLRHPTPWYGGTGSGHYFNAAFLFHEPLELSASEELHLKYRVLVHDGILSSETLNDAYESYAGAKSD